MHMNNMLENKLPRTKWAAFLLVKAAHHRQASADIFFRSSKVILHGTAQKHS